MDRETTEKPIISGQNGAAAAILATPTSKATTSAEGTPTPTPRQETPAVTVVGSKSGTKYHLPDCPGAKRIKPENLITFESIEAAKAAGYTPAANCPGLKQNN